MSDFDTKDISDIRIEDPLNFLTAAEKEEYIRTQDAERMRARREELSRTQELQRLEEERIATERKRAAALQRKQRASQTGQKKRRRTEAERRRAAEARRQREKEERMERIVRIASIVTGSLILLLLLWIGVSYVRAYFADRAEDNQIAADADGALPEEDDTPGTTVEVEGFTAMNDTVVTTNDLRLRTTPDSSQDNNIVTTAAKGTELKRTGINESIGWSRVEYNGQTLYCSSKYLTSR